MNAVPKEAQQQQGSLTEPSELFIKLKRKIIEPLYGITITITEG